MRIKIQLNVEIEVEDYDHALGFARQADEFLTDREETLVECGIAFRPLQLLLDEK